VEFLTTLAGDAMITLCYHRPLDEAWQAAARQLAAALGVSVIGRSKGKRLVIGRDYAVETRRRRPHLQLPPAGRRVHPAQRHGEPEDAQLGLRGHGRS
jgi:hypothetical protein